MSSQRLRLFPKNILLIALHVKIISPEKVSTSRSLFERTNSISPSISCLFDRSLHHIRSTMTTPQTPQRPQRQPNPISPQGTSCMHCQTPCSGSTVHCIVCLGDVGKVCKSPHCNQNLPKTIIMRSSSFVVWFLPRLIRSEEANDF